MLIGGIVLLVLGAVLIFVHVRARKRVMALLLCKKKTSAQLAETQRVLTEELGDGAMSEPAELVGRIECGELLVSPLGEQPCLYYEMTVSREYEEQVRERDSEGNTRTRTRRGSEVMSSQSESMDFYLDDGTGQTLVRLSGANFDQLHETVDQFEPEGGGTLSYGRFSLSLSGGMMGGGRRTLGYQYREKILAASGQLTVCGLVTETGGQLSVGRGGDVFVVSPRTKKEMLGSAESTVKFTAIGSGVSALVGIVLTIAGLIAG